MKGNCMEHFDIKPESDLVCILVVDVRLCIFHSIYRVAHSSTYLA